MSLYRAPKNSPQDQRGVSVVGFTNAAMMQQVGKL